MHIRTGISTNRGNRKLNDVFRETQDDTTEADSVCPIFLFFSVNWSGQFVGVAEMIGRVDFVKTLNFWLIEDWNGFFPVKWHIIKDIPNRQLSHIITESSEPVTRTRDMQEIGLQQGLEMLNIFKNYTVMTSMLDDFNFYKKREQSLRAKRNSVRAT
ncbi:YTH domain-containing protein [Heracleum sosnowskyi]|uniref:YTH domain-containing family protein n=1 Tax=Heracleum sosnowskyi TaxID=360622 RepID=A0AAD8IF46_9APIA|nr:YTH domain-containing protein [Heracleum sosnowskyi]